MEDSEDAPVPESGETVVDVRSYALQARAIPLGKLHFDVCQKRPEAYVVL